VKIQRLIKVSTIFGLAPDGVSKATLTAPIRVRLWNVRHNEPLHKSGSNGSPSLKSGEKSTISLLAINSFMGGLAKYIQFIG